MIEENITKEKDDWIDYFFNLAKTISKKSKDPSRKIGCVISGPDNEIRSTGYNGFPRNVLELDSRISPRKEKLKWTEHAERNAIYNAARVGIPLKGCKIYIWGLPPCIECTRAIIQSGIVEVRYKLPENETIDEEKIKDFENYSLVMLRENKIKCIRCY